MASAFPMTYSDTFSLVGGLDTESSQLTRTAGLVEGSINYESSTSNGYERIGGFERFDGRPRPSDATHLVLESDTAFVGVAVGNTINGQTSGATAKVVSLRGGYQLVLTKVVGSFVQGENIRVGTTVVGVYSRVGTDITDADDCVLSALAADDYRADIAAVPGSGPMRGIAVLGSTVYAFRNNVGGTALAIYKSTSGGWSAVSLFNELSFTGGSGAAPAEGSTITKGATSAVVRRVVVTSGDGTWSGAAVAGRFIVDNVTGGPFTAGAFTGGVTATCSGAQTAISLLPGGRVDSVVYNFTGSTATQRLYGCDGVNPGWEFDGTTLVPIRTGMAADKPNHVTAHRNHLFFSFGGSVQHSSITKPYMWSVVTGAAEIAVSDDVTGFSTMPGDAGTAPLLIYSEGRTVVLYGTSSSDWKLATYSGHIGAQRWSAQNIGNPVVRNTLGITSLVPTADYGNFTMEPASERIRSWLKGKTVTASVTNRNATRVRVFFSDATAVSVTPVRGVLCFMPVDYGMVVRCAVDASISGVQRNFFAGDDGFVYEADVGRSFDGEVITAWMKLAFNFIKSPHIKKRFRRVVFEARPQSYCNLHTQSEFSMGQIDIGLSTVAEIPVTGAGGIYDISAWDASYFDSPSQSLAAVRIDGVGTSMSLSIFSESANQLPHTVLAVTTNYTPRRMER